MKLKVTITDNVLDSNDWPIDELTLDLDGRIYIQNPIKTGVYTIPNMLNWMLDDLHEWLQYESVGQHPEIGHELAQ